MGGSGGERSVSCPRTRIENLCATLLREVSQVEGGVTFMVFGHWQVHDDVGRRKYLNTEERGRFLATADLAPPPTRALCYLLTYTGCRISEALALTADHLDGAESVVRFRTLKRRRPVIRAVPIPVEMMTMLSAVPASSDGRLWPIHRSTAWRRVTTVMEGASIAGPMACCRGCRHGFGIRAAAGRVPTNLIQRWMGHASPETTAIYLDAIGIEEREFASRMW